MTSDPALDAAPVDVAVMGTGWLSRFERFDVVGSTNDVVAGWLRDGTPEVCVAVADVQAAGRGRAGRTWAAPAGASVLLSVGFRPSWLDVRHVWRLGAIVSMAMAEACEVAGGLRDGAISLKWPNDLVAIDRTSGDVRKLAGMLGETDGLGTADPTAVIGIGANVGWPRDRFPAELSSTMTSLSELAPGRTIDREVVLDEFLRRLDAAVASLRGGTFDAAAWSRRQLTNGMIVLLEQADGTPPLRVVAQDVDTDSGALLVNEPGDGGATRPVVVGEIRHLRLGGIV